jgi:hypothetical protein
MHTLQGGEHIEYNENELKAILMSDIFPGVLQSGFFVGRSAIAGVTNEGRVLGFVRGLP